METRIIMIPQAAAAAPRNSFSSCSSSSSSYLQLPSLGQSVSNKFQTPFPTCFLSPKPTTTGRISSSKPINTPHSLPDHGSTTQVTNVDQQLEVKKKATEVAPELKGSSIYLVGMKSRVKTNLGKLLADALRYYFFDSDSLMDEAVGGASASKEFRERDDKGFRQSETEVLKQLSSMGRLVVSAGDGAVGSATNLSLLRHGISIWIDLPLDVVAREVVDHDLQLPALELSSSESYPEVFAQVSDLYKQMQGGYATADATISLQKVAWQLGYEDVDAVTVEDLGLEVLKEISKLMRVKKLMEEAARPF